MPGQPTPVVRRWSSGLTRRLNGYAGAQFVQVKNTHEITLVGNKPPSTKLAPKALLLLRVLVSVLGCSEAANG